MTEDSSVTPGLFTPFALGSLRVTNRFVMAPMTREFSREGTPAADAARYYGRRAEGGLGLIITEGICVEDPSAAASTRVPVLHTLPAQARWREVIQSVHDAGGKIVAQIWHVGLDRDPSTSPLPDVDSIGPGTWFGWERPAARAMTSAGIAHTVEAFARSAATAQDLGFDGVELHGAHGYLIDQFLWERTNRRDDAYGGSVRNRSRFAEDVIRGVRARVGDDYPIIFRVSQWNTIDFDARPFDNPDTLEQALAPLVDAGVTAFHASTRRFWQPEYEGSDLNLAGWIKKLTGLPTMTVGSVALDGADFFGALLTGEGAQPAPLTALNAMFDRGDFDLVASGRALISDPDLVHKLQGSSPDVRIPFNPADLLSLT